MLYPTTCKAAAWLYLVSFPLTWPTGTKTVDGSAVTGTEGILFELSENASGVRRTLKVYHPHVQLKPEVLRRLRQLRCRTVAKLIDYGQLPDDRWWELLERIQGNNFVDYRDRPNGKLGNDALVAAVSEIA